jgi:hypothetical protein
MYINESLRFVLTNREIKWLKEKKRKRKLRKKQKKLKKEEDSTFFN